jgi:hypothetical protein
MADPSVGEGPKLSQVPAGVARAGPPRASVHDTPSSLQRLDKPLADDASAGTVSGAKCCFGGKYS